MKKTIFIFSILFAFKAQAQVIDSTISDIAAVKIQPFKAKFSDSLNSTHLGIRVVSDDLKSTATLYWVIKQSNGVKSVEGNYILEGQEYEDWCNNNVACNLWPFVVVANKYGLTFKND